MISIARGSRDLHGTWRPVSWRVARLFKAVLSCPDCGREMTLRKYTIATNGLVSPDVECTLCGFRDQITLLNWNGGQV